jgi:Zn-dependent protease with chaperone function
VVSRTFEFQADAFAVSQGFADALKHALISLQKENKSALHVGVLVLLGLWLWKRKLCVANSATAGCLAC